MYYGNTSSFDSVSLPLTGTYCEIVIDAFSFGGNSSIYLFLIIELATELYNEVKKDKSLERLQVREAAEINQNACVSTCSLVLAILYLEKIRTLNPEYVDRVAPSELFVVSLVSVCFSFHFFNNSRN